MTTTDDRKYVVIRATDAGVFCGFLESEDGRTVVLSEARHIWYRDGASATDELAERGTSRPENCKFTAPASHPVKVHDVNTILTATSAATESLRAVPAWSQFK